MEALLHENLPGIGSKPGGTRSDKKRRAQRGAKQTQLLAASALVNTIYISYYSYALLLASHSDSDANSTSLTSVILYFTFHNIVSFGLGQFILNSIRDGFLYEYYFDMFAVNLTTQLLSLYSSNAYYLLLIVPGFILFKLGFLIKQFVFSKSSNSNEMLNNGAQDDVSGQGAGDKRSTRRSKRLAAATGRRG